MLAAQSGTINATIQIPHLFVPRPFLDGQTSGTKNGDKNGNSPARAQSSQFNIHEEGPFCVYKEAEIQKSIAKCNKSLIGKFLTEKPIHKMTIHNGLSGMWCNPGGLKMTEMKGNLYYIVVDSAEDHRRIHRGSPWF
jgi:hypothetical protein